MIYKECLKSKSSLSSIKFNDITELTEQLDSIKNSNIKKISLIRDEIVGVSPIIVRNLLLDYFAGTEVEIIMFI